MGLTVKFVSGKEQRSDATAAGLADYGRLFVLYKWNPKKRKSESGETFDASQVVMTILDNGDIVLGKGLSKQPTTESRAATADFTPRGILSG